MILNEDYGNLQALSPQAQKFIYADYSNDSLKKNIGRNSPVKIVRQDKIKDVLKDLNAFSLPFFVLRYKGVDKIYFYSNGGNYWVWTVTKYDRRWKGFTFSTSDGKVDGYKSVLEKIYNSFFKEEVSSFEDFLKNISYQLVFTDEDRIEKQDKRSKSLGKILKKDTHSKSYVTDDDIKRNNPKAYSKIHGNVYDTRNTYGYYRNSLKERLKKYVESKFPSFNSFEDFDKADIKDILKAFKIKDYVYNYDKTTTERIDRDPLMNLYKNKRSYIGYHTPYNSKDNPTDIFFEITLDVNGKVRVTNVYGTETYSSKLEPLSKWFEKKDDKDNKDNKLSHNYNIDDEDDW